MEAIFLKFTFFTFIPLSIIAVLISNNRTFSIFYKGYHKYAIIRRDCKLKCPISGLLHVFALSTGYDLQIMTVFNIELQADIGIVYFKIRQIILTRDAVMFFSVNALEILCAAFCPVSSLSRQMHTLRMNGLPSIVFHSTLSETPQAAA